MIANMSVECEMSYYENVMYSGSQGLVVSPHCPKDFCSSTQLSTFVLAVLLRLHFSPKQINLVFSLSIFKLKDNLWDSRRFVGTSLSVFLNPCFSEGEDWNVHVLKYATVFWDEGTWYWDVQFLKLSFYYLCWHKIRGQAQGLES